MNQVERITEHLRKNNADFDDVHELLPEYGKGDICIPVSWGDWKHSHMWLDQLMHAAGYELVDELVTEENGSDCYSSEHYYKLKTN